MAWERLYSETTNDVTATFTALPLVLSGPILRKVTNTEVNVWLALKESQSSIILTVYDADGNLVTTTSSTSTTQLGSNLHVVLLSLDGLNLLTNTVYYYDIVFDSNVDLTTATGGADLAYGYPIAGLDSTDDRQKLNNLPSFALPPNDLNDLRIIHGSCRKPHGGGKPGRRDALPALDKMIFEAEDNAQAFALDLNTNDVDRDVYDQTFSAKRPHQLFFTGDQIYADDVATPLLAMLVDAGKALMCGDSEILPTTPNEDALRVGYREEIMTDVAKFTSYSVGSNHLVKLQEFYAMYLFVWTDVLWPSLLPDFSTVLPNEDSTVTNVYYNHRLSETTNFENEFTDAYKSFNENKALLNDFKQDLSTVRKSMANVPTYMIFDDHDVTDDWNLHRLWKERVEVASVNNNLGIRIIQNALSAYTVFQHWGNIGTSDVHVNEVVNNLNTWGGINSNELRDYFKLKSEGINKIDFHYQLDFNYYKVKVLDTRTERGFMSGNGQQEAAAELIAGSKLMNQLPNLTDSEDLEFMLLISPAPIIGHTFMEDYVQTGAIKFIDMDNVDDNGNEEHDREAWKSNEVIFEELLKQLNKFDRVIVLSGDVHYGYGAEIDYWNIREGNEKISKLIQCTVSSLKNNDGKTIGLGKVGSLISKTTDYIGFSERANAFIEVRHNIPFDGEYIEYKLNARAGASKVQGALQTIINVYPEYFPNWQYRINFIKDNRSKEDRGTYNSVIEDIPAEIENHLRLYPITIHRNMQKYDAMRTVVGFNNIGELNFLWNTAEKKIIQSHWYSPEMNNASLLPYTQLQLNCVLLNSNEKKFN